MDVDGEVWTVGGQTVTPPVGANGSTPTPPPPPPPPPRLVKGLLSSDSLCVFSSVFTSRSSYRNLNQNSVSQRFWLMASERCCLTEGVWLSHEAELTAAGCDHDVTFLWTDFKVNIYSLGFRCDSPGCFGDFRLIDMKLVSL